MAAVLTLEKLPYCFFFRVRFLVKLMKRKVVQLPRSCRPIHLSSGRRGKAYPVSAFLPFLYVIICVNYYGFIFSAQEPSSG